jgi:outer membrane receptor protein involved in Fe transport
MKYNKITKGIALVLGFTSIVVQAEDLLDETIETIVVSGQKIDRTIKETVNSVSVLTAKDMIKQNVKNVSDIYDMAPNISGGLNTGYSIRGINFDSVSGGGGSYLTSIYLDGASLPYRVIRSGATSVWDISQVEIFRGPQSTLQGRNALAGAIMMRTQDPTYEWTSKAKATVGQYDQKEFAFAAGGALIDDVLAFRIGYEDKEYAGDIDNITRNEGSNFEESQLLRAKVLFEPTENFTALLTATNTENKIGPRWALYDFGSSLFDREVDTNSPIWESTDTDIYNLEMSWELTDELSVHAITTYSDSDYAYNWDGDMQPTQITADSTYSRTDKTFSQELRLNYETETLKAVFGGYFSDLEVNDDAAGERLLSFESVGLPPLPVLLMAPASMGGFGLPAEYAAMVLPLYPDIDPVMLGSSAVTSQQVKTAALYTDVTWSMNEQWDLLLGLRYDTEQQENSADSLYTVLNTIPDPALIPAPLNQIVAGINGSLLQLANNASGTELPTEEDFNAWLPKIGLSYHISDETTASFVYQKGYRSGGVGFNIFRSESYSYKPEYTDNYELSLRSVWLDGKMMLNSNVFYTDWQDQQVNRQLSAANFDLQTENAGASNIKGIEVELFYYPSNNLSIVTGIGFADSEFTEFQVSNSGSQGLRDLTGRSFEDAPQWTANVAVNYEINDHWFANMNANYSGSELAYLDPLTTLAPVKYAINSDPKNDAHLLVNAQIGYTWTNYTIRLNARNLLDNDYISSYTSEADNLGTDDSYGQGIPGRPRTVNLTLEVDF